MAEYWLETLKYGAQEIPISEGLLTVIAENDTWSLRIITDEEWKAGSMATRKELRATTKDGHLVVMHGRCTLATENSRYHFEGEGPVAVAKV